MTQYQLIQEPDLLHPGNPNEAQFTQLDITKPEMVEVSMREDGKVLWVNVNGRCVLRVCQITYASVSLGGNEIVEVIDGSVSLISKFRVERRPSDASSKNNYDGA